MIKKYLSFLTESKFEEIKQQNHTVGEYIEKLAEGDEFVQMMVSQYTESIDPSIRMANAINVLSEFDQRQLLKRVEDHKNGIKSDDKVEVSSTVEVDLEPVHEAYGKSVVQTFFKCLTALGLKDNTPEKKEFPPEYLIFFRFPSIDSAKVSGVFNRFKSLSELKIDYNKGPKMGIYFGIKISGQFEYGYYHDEVKPIGSFQLSKSIINSFKTSDLKSLSGLKKSLTDLNYQDILLLGRIKTDMQRWDPGKSKQVAVPLINGRVISFGYYGVGRWEDGKMDNNDFQRIKMALNDFISDLKWHDKILFKMQENSFWIQVHIKLK